MTADHLPIREAALATGCPRNRLFYLLMQREVAYLHPDPSGPYLVKVADVEAVGERGMAWAREWARSHPVVRVDRLERWGE